MTTFYLDPENGNDANDGLTFANRWKTLTSGPTAARTAPGDTIRVMASRPKQNIGASTWTDNTKRLSVATPPWQVIDQAESGWTAATNVTITYPTTNFRVGTARLNLSILTAFTTGKAAYKTLASPLDLSAFQQIGYAFRPDGTTQTSQITVKLCSDTTGDVPVDSFTLPISTSYTISYWADILADKGSALGSAINSIAIYVDVDPSASANRSITFDNFVAFKAPTDAACITNRSIISKQTVGEPEWYPVHGFDGSEIIIGGGAATTFYETFRLIPWRGTSETVDLWVINPTPGWGSTERTIQEPGTDAAPIAYSFGWNRTDMSTQTDVTWLTGYGFLTIPWATIDGRLDFEKFGVVHYTTCGISINTGNYLQCEGILGCEDPINTANPGSAGTHLFKLDCKQVWSHVTAFGNDVEIPGKVKIGRLHGVPKGSSFAGVNYKLFMDEVDVLSIGRIDNCGYGISTENTSRPDVRLRNCTLDNNDTDVFTGQQCVTHLDNCTLNSTTKIYQDPFSNGRSALRQTRIGGDVNLHSYSTPWAVLESQNTVTHSAGYAWRLYSRLSSPVSFVASAPFTFQLAQFAVEANKLVTVKCWIRRARTDINPGLWFKDFEIDGIVETGVYMTAAIDTWEEVTITGTPTVDGVMTVYGCGWASTTNVGNFAYFDDLTITQAA